MDWHLPVAIAAVLFGVFVLFRFRPLVGGVSQKAARGELKEARARLANAKTDAERVEALLAAADACARTVGLAGAASSYYLRAMRVAPDRTDLVERAAAGLARRPRLLETLLWRRLGAEPWTGPHADATRAVLKELLALYGNRRRSQLRLRMVERALEAIGGERPLRTSISPDK